MSAQLPLVHLTRPPTEASARPPLLLLLHGVGSNEQDLFELAPYLDPRFLILSVRAPIPLARGSYAWFHVDLTPHDVEINPAEAEASRLKLLEFIPAAIQAYNADPERVYLAGFSQGAIMSASVMLTEPEPLAGVVAMSGRILPEVRPLMASPERLAGFPVLVVHGLYDEVLPISYGRASRDLLAALPVQLTYREYPMAHQISDESLLEVRTWLSERLTEKRR